ncbi:hypothetical protein [Saccharopolyspora erythraea]|uniref:Uncharacterized protein n=1 Tax=Saccharopolyspora erythraea TaxID=1836 RepID=A0ABP3P9P2_SACER|nr:hypothetical protein [Saccharopolyspora erythraea]QRK88399.1 hypothetical protein JQX30_27530 [Saccharopolyspora erythraea]
MTGLFDDDEGSKALEIARLLRAGPRTRHPGACGGMRGLGLLPCMIRVLAAFGRVNCAADATERPPDQTDPSRRSRAFLYTRSELADYP